MSFVLDQLGYEVVKGFWLMFAAYMAGWFWRIVLTMFRSANQRWS
jgi:hypothetical protein